MTRLIRVDLCDEGGIIRTRKFTDHPLIPDWCPLEQDGPDWKPSVKGERS